MASSLFIDISACGVLDVCTKSVQPALHTASQEQLQHPEFQMGIPAPQAPSWSAHCSSGKHLSCYSTSAGFCFPFLACIFLSWKSFYCFIWYERKVGNVDWAVTLCQALCCALDMDYLISCSSSRPEEGATINPISRGGNWDETGNSDTQVSLDPEAIFYDRV